MEFKDVLLVILPILSSYVTYYFSTKSRKNEAIFRYKEEKYSNLLVSLQGFVGTTTSSKLKKGFFEEQYKSWLYSSDEVVRAINSMVELIITHASSAPPADEGRQAIGNIVLAMRKDLLGRTRLDWRHFRYTDVLE